MASSKRICLVTLTSGINLIGTHDPESNVLEKAVIVRFIPAEDSIIVNFAHANPMSLGEDNGVDVDLNRIAASILVPPYVPADVEIEKQYLSQMTGLIVTSQG